MAGRRSPILSNIVLNELDHKLEERNLGYCRWADDFVIAVRTERAAQRVMVGTIRYLEEELGLIVNREKSRVTPIKDITFLGFQLLRGKIRVSNKAKLRFKDPVREGATHHRRRPTPSCGDYHRTAVQVCGLDLKPHLTINR